MLRTKRSRVATPSSSKLVELGVAEHALLHRLIARLVIAGAVADAPARHIDHLHLQLVKAARPHQGDRCFRASRQKLSSWERSASAAPPVWKPGVFSFPGFAGGVGHPCQGRTLSNIRHVTGSGRDCLRQAPAARCWNGARSGHIAGPAPADRVDSTAAVQRDGKDFGVKCSGGCRCADCRISAA